MTAPNRGVPGPKPGNSLNLETAVHNWLTMTLSRPPDASVTRVPGPSGGPHRAIVVADDFESSLLEVARQLGNSSCFRSLASLQLFLSDSLVVMLRETPSAQIDAVVVELATRLRSPQRQFSFTAPLCLHGGLELSVSMGGQHDLIIQPDNRDGQRILLTSGKVEAPTEPDALLTVEEILETILGLSLALDLCSMMAALPGHGHHDLSVRIVPHDERILSRLSPVISTAISEAIVRIPGPRSDLDLRHIAAGDHERLLEAPLRLLCCVMASTERRAVELQRAGAFLLRGSVTPDLGLALTYGFMCLEAVLLERSQTDNILARLVEAVAYRLGKSTEDRTKLRREIKDLYDLRSRYVHTGQAGGAAWTKPRERCLDIVARVLQREIVDTAL